MSIFSHINDGNNEERGDDARRTTEGGVSVIKSILKTMLGPMGAFKIMQGPKGMIVTNDGATVLKSLVIDNPIAKMLIDLSISQDWEEGDGTTSVALLSALIIEEIYKLKIHPTLIIKGLQIGLDRALSKLEELAMECSEDDLINLAKTTICSKVLKCDLPLFSKICVDAISSLQSDSDLNLIQIIKCTGKLEESFLSEGFILKKDLKILRMENAKVLIANTALDFDKIKIFGAKINVDSIKKLGEIEEAEKAKMRNKIEKICSVDFDCFINRQLIYDYPLELFRAKKIVPIEHADFDGVERLVKFLGGRIVSTFDNLSTEVLGFCGCIENISVGNERMIKFENKQRSACTIVLRGSSDEILDEAERSIHDALCVLNKIRKNRKVVYGGGATEMEISLDLKEYAKSTPTVESETILALAAALEQIPDILCESGGLDGTLIKSKIRAAHADKDVTSGVDFKSEDAGSMKTAGVLESLRIKRRVLMAAVEGAQMAIKCDGFIKIKPRERTRE